MLTVTFRRVPWAEAPIEAQVQHRTQSPGFMHATAATTGSRSWDVWVPVIEVDPRDKNVVLDDPLDAARGNALWILEQMIARDGIAA